MSSTQVNKRGVKRKRGEAPEEDVKTQLGRKLFHELKAVKLAAKKAKTFEFQKQVKRLKTLRKKNASGEEVAAAEAQLTAIKELESDHLGIHAFRTKVAKDRALSQHEDFAEAFASQCSGPVVSPAPPSTHLGKVQARVLSSKVLASEVLRILGDLREAVGLENSANKKAATIALVTDASEENDGVEDASDDDEDVHTPGEPAVDDDGWESGTVRGSDEDDSDDESADLGSVEGEEVFDKDMDSADEDRPVRPKPVPSAQKKARPDTSRPGESVFLPSLSVGFVRGDSDSEWSDSEAKLADGGERKNRRGQRARRAIWEKKYGRNAVHVKKQREVHQATGRDAHGRRIRPDARSGQSAPPGARRPPAGSARPPPPVRPPPARAGPPSSGRREAPRQDNNSEKPLHPSWEAKRKQHQTHGIMPSAGTKIKFKD